MCQTLGLPFSLPTNILILLATPTVCPSNRLLEVATVTSFKQTVGGGHSHVLQIDCWRWPLPQCVLQTYCWRWPLPSPSNRLLEVATSKSFKHTAGGGHFQVLQTYCWRWPLPQCVLQIDCWRWPLPQCVLQTDCWRWPLPRPSNILLEVTTPTMCPSNRLLEVATPTSFKHIAGGDHSHNVSFK